jgi:hypothetical protein
VALGFRFRLDGRRKIEFFRVMARCQVASLDATQIGPLVDAGILVGVGAPGVEEASRWRVGGIGEVVGEPDRSWLKLVPRWPVDLVERCAEVFGYGLFGGEGVVAGVDLDAAVAA